MLGAFGRVIPKNKSPLPASPFDSVNLTRRMKIFRDPVWQVGSQSPMLTGNLEGPP